MLEAKCGLEITRVVAILFSQKYIKLPCCRHKPSYDYHQHYRHPDKIAHLCTMDLATLPDDFFVTLGQYTKTVYRDQYPAIDPRSAALSQKGKVVIITGASQGLGRHVS